MGAWGAPELLPVAHSPCGVLLQAEASGHVHHVTWILRAAIAQGHLGEEDDFLSNQPLQRPHPPQDPARRGCPVPGADEKH